MNILARRVRSDDPAELLAGLEGELGPAMRALGSDRMRLFVCALFQVKPGHGAQAAAYRMAGYRSRTPQQVSANSSILANDERVQAAISEEQNRRLNAMAPGALRALQNMIGDPKHKDHCRAVQMLLDRVAPATLHVKREERLTVVDPGQVMAQIAQIAKRVGVNPAALARPVQTIEAEAVVDAANSGGGDAGA